MRTHVKVVGIVNLIFSALGLLSAAGALFGGVLSSVASGSLIVMIVGTAASVFWAVVIGALSLLGLLAGFALLSHQAWARNTLIVVSALRLFRWPFGTLFGAYSLWVLLNDETRVMFEARTV
jgi:hypothetical protein